MAEKTEKPAPLLSEPVPIFETFVTGVAEARDCGDFVRVTFFVDRPVTGTPETERAVVARLIVPRGSYETVLSRLDLAGRAPQQLAVA